MSIGKSRYLGFLLEWAKHSDKNYLVVCGSYHRAKELFREAEQVIYELPYGTVFHQLDLRLTDGDAGGCLRYEWTKERIRGLEIQGVWFDEFTPWGLRSVAASRLRRKSEVKFKPETTYDQTCVHPDQKSVQYTCEQPTENRMISAHDGLRLPNWWLCNPYKSACIHRLRLGKPVHDMPPDWRNQSYKDRMRVIHHLMATGELTAGNYLDLTGHHYVPSRLAGYMPYSGTVTGRSVQPNLCVANLQEYRKLDRTQDAERQLWLNGDWSTIEKRVMHSDPNGGKRILPSIYTKLTTHWLQRSGEYIEPRCMSLHHLKCTIALLHESHGNFVARACLMAGKVHAHLDCDPVTQSHMQAACLEIQKLDISKLYPIFDLLAKEYELKLKNPPPSPTMLDIETSALEWDDK